MGAPPDPVEVLSNELARGLHMLTKPNRALEERRARERGKDMADDMKTISGPEDLARAIEQAGKDRDDRLSSDPEWTTAEFIHKHEIVTAFAVGVLRADPWHKNYAPPPGFGTVIEYIARRVEREWAEDGEVVEVSLLDLRARFTEWVSENVTCRAWNEAPGSGWCDRYTPTPEAREFIDLDALVMNACIFVRDRRRADADFERRSALRTSEPTP